ncbi:hypothetical protein AAVH_25760 [Aphelenchoides avenae]|nr:hypothetical protein AAVH_25760 [Aphelenchus avenae]
MLAFFLVLFLVGCVDGDVRRGHKYLRPRPRNALAGAPRITFDNGTMVDVIFAEGFGAEVYSSTFRIVLPVPVEQGKPLVYPRGNPCAGTPVLDHNQKPIIGDGLVFVNYMDGNYQAVRSDGNEVIIFGSVILDANSVPKEVRAITREDWHAFHALVMDIVPGGKVKHLTLELIEEILTLTKDKEIQLTDRYNSNRKYVSGLVPIDVRGDHYGLYRRDDKEPCRAVYVMGDGKFEGKGTVLRPALGEQKFTGSAVIVDCKTENDPRLVQWSVFKATYKIWGFPKVQPEVRDLPVYSASASRRSGRRKGLVSGRRDECRA